jgi:hypothetical protein
MVDDAKCCEPFDYVEAPEMALACHRVRSSQIQYPNPLIPQPQQPSWMIISALTMRTDEPQSVHERCGSIDLVAGACLMHGPCQTFSRAIVLLNA